MFIRFIRGQPFFPHGPQLGELAGGLDYPAAPYIGGPSQRSLRCYASGPDSILRRTRRDYVAEGGDCAEVCFIALQFEAELCAYSHGEFVEPVGGPASDPDIIDLQQSVAVTDAGIECGTAFNDCGDALVCMGVVGHEDRTEPVMVERLGMDLLGADIGLACGAVDDQVELSERRQTEGSRISRAVSVRASAAGLLDGDIGNRQWTDLDLVSPGLLDHPEAV